MSNVIGMNTRRAPRSASSAMETLFLTPATIDSWTLPGFQRPLRINSKVMALSEEMKADGVSIKGILTLGRLKGDDRLFLVDGQHRVEAFRLSQLKEIIADIRVVHFDTMAEMAEEYVELNSYLVRMKPDDLLRGLEPTTPILKHIRTECRFVGYDNVRRHSSSSPVVGMSTVIRCWVGSEGETPILSKGSAVTILPQVNEVSAEQLIAFLNAAYSAWGRDPEYFRLWSSINLSMTMWMWRHIVLRRDRGQKRYTHLTATQFKACMMSMSTSGDYIMWLQGRIMGDRDRNPCYQRIKAIFVRRISSEIGTKVKFPQPSWAST